VSTKRRPGECSKPAVTECCCRLISRTLEGGLTSDITPSENLDFAFMVKGDSGPPRPALEAEYAELGISDFCVRMICNIARSSSLKEGVIIKYSILLFPRGKDPLLRKYEVA
jgi:hypothetical protein